MRIAVVIPTKNEEATIAFVIGCATAEIKKLGHEVAAVIITDDSKDRTRAIATGLGAKVVIGEGKGLGFAMLKGLKASLAYNPDIILSMDGDGQSAAGEIAEYLAPVIRDEADMVLGSRFKDKDLVKYHYRLKNRIGIFILVRILRALTKLPLTDSHGGLRAMRPEVVRELEMIGTHTYVQETIIDTREKGFRIVEIPSVWEARQAGKSRVVGSIPLYVMYTLPVLILRSGQHIKFLYPLGAAFLACAAADLLFVFANSAFSLSQILENKSFNTFFLLMSFGMNFLFFGFVLELINSIKRRVDKI
jgi:glycosyltransferase involved in cell wall biosynthesis